MVVSTAPQEYRVTDPHALKVVPAGGGPPVFEVDTLTRTTRLNGRVLLNGIFIGDVELARVPGSTYSTVQHVQDLIHSAGWISGGAVSDAGGATIDVAAGTGLIKIADSAVAELQFFDWAALAGTVIPADTTRYVGVEYNNGSPQVVVRTVDNWNNNTDFELGIVVNEGGTLHIARHPHQVGDHANQMLQRLHGVAHIARDNEDGGLILGESGVNKVTLTAGTLWSGLTNHSIAALDTNVAGSFDRYYRDFPTGFVKEATQTDWPNEEYDDGSGALVTMTNNRYAVLWFYLETDGNLVMLYGQNQYTSAAMAENESAPTTVPDRIAAHGMLIGRLTYQKSAAAATEISSVFTTMLPQTGVTAHADLAGVTSGQHHVAFVQADADLLYDLLGGLATHEVLDTGVHGAGVSTLATAADIATHAGLGGAHHVAFVQADADLLYDILGGLATHEVLDTGVHGAGADVLATDADIATHAGATGAHHTLLHGAAQHNVAALPGSANENLGAFYLDIDDIAVPANPGVGIRRLFVDTATGEISVRTNAGATVSLEGAGGGGDVATDAIWDAKGDLAGGTGANTAARLAVGSDGTILGALAAEATGMVWFARSGIAELADIANIEAAGSDTTIPFGDHVHAHPSGLTANLHHAKYTDAEVDAIVLTHKNIGGAHHIAQQGHHASFLAADADLLYEALGDIAIHAAIGGAHHVAQQGHHSVESGESGTHTHGNLYYTETEHGGVTPQGHHDKYLDSEAISAVEGEATLALSGVVALAKYLELDEVAAPSAPAANVGQIYVEDDGGVTRPYFQDSDGFKQEMAGYTLIDSVVLGGSAQTLASFTGIPAKFRNLRVVFFGYDSGTGSAVREVILRFNGDSGANYHWRRIVNGTEAQALSDTEITLGALDGTIDERETWGTIDIINYAATGHRRAVNIQAGYLSGTTMTLLDVAALWTNTADAIDRVDILSANADTTFDANSVAYLYGY